nr:hypothetical protein [Tanacetum cinerariifolium]
PVAAPTVVAAYTRRRKGVIIRDPEEGLSSKTPAETPKLKDKGKGILIETLKPIKKKDQIKLDAEYARKLHEEINKDHEEINKDIDWDAAIDHVKQKSKEIQYIKRYQVMKKRPQTESEARKNMMIYLKNTAGYKLDLFKGMSYDEIRPIFQARFDANMSFLLKSREEIEEENREVLKSINETPAQKAAKRRKLNEEAQEVEDLKKHLEVVNDEDDDVFKEATPLARKPLELMLSKRSRKNTKVNAAKCVTPPDGAWMEYVSGGVTLLRISSTKHKERPLRIRIDRRRRIPGGVTTGASGNSYEGATIADGASKIGALGNFRVKVVCDDDRDATLILHSIMWCR